MFCEDVCLGKTSGLDKLRAINDELNAKVVDQLSGNQKLIILTDFERESIEYTYKKYLRDRISDISSWQWVLEDLSKRLQESIDALKYEHNALRVVVDRVRSEMRIHSNDSSQRGAICPLSDDVEVAIAQEYEYLRDQKKYFENLIEELDKKTVSVEKTKRLIDIDVRNKKQTLLIEETSLHKDYNNIAPLNCKRNKNCGWPMARWEKRCARLKRSGLKALCNALVTRKQVRGARMDLSITAQAFSIKVEATLRRRLHTNRIKLQDLNWQREEAVRDYNSLQEELIPTEMAVIGTMNQEIVLQSRLADRSQRPSGELTKDDVNRTLREEQIQLKKTLKHLRNNIDRIVSLQNKLNKAITNTDCYAEDLMHVITLDEERIRSRQGETKRVNSVTPTENVHLANMPQVSETSGQLTVIQEEDEDDYPFNF